MSLLVLCVLVFAALLGLLWLQERRTHVKGLAIAAFVCGVLLIKVD